MGARHYKRAGKLMKEITALMKTGESIKLPSGEFATLEEKAGKYVFFDRYEISIIGS